MQKLKKITLFFFKKILPIEIIKKTDNKKSIKNTNKINKKRH